MAEKDANQLLREAAQGDENAGEQLTPLVYDELRRIAGSYMRAGSQVTLQPTAVVHEAFLRLADSGVDDRSQTHFQALAAVAMRHVLVDHLRAAGRDKRGGSWDRVTLSALPGDQEG